MDLKIRISGATKGSVSVSVFSCGIMNLIPPGKDIAVGTLLSLVLNISVKKHITQKKTTLLLPSVIPNDSLITIVPTGESSFTLMHGNDVLPYHIQGELFHQYMQRSPIFVSQMLTDWKSNQLDSWAIRHALSLAEDDRHRLSFNSKSRTEKENTHFLLKILALYQEIIRRRALTTPIMRSVTALTEAQAFKKDAGLFIPVDVMVQRASSMYLADPSIYALRSGRNQSFVPVKVPPQTEVLYVQEDGFNWVAQ